ncbi:MAG TPA: hypothetical protein VIG47_06800, partial [Gemmatimonadaceae bacterium]
MNLHVDITASGDEAERQVGVTQATLDKLGSTVTDLSGKLGGLKTATTAAAGSVDVASRAYELAKGHLESYRAAIDNAARTQQLAQAQVEKLGAATKDNINAVLAQKSAIVDASREEETAITSFTAKARALATQRIASINAEAEARKISTAQQIAALNELKVAVEGSAVAQGLVEAALGKVQAETVGLGAIFGKFGKDVETHSRTAYMALDGLGMKGAATAAKVSGLGQLLNGMGAVTPQIIAIGIAVGAVFAAFSGAKAAADAAMAWEKDMALLGQTVRNQGGDWKILAGEVQAWAEVQERSTTYSRDEAVTALNTLTASG